MSNKDTTLVRLYVRTTRRLRAVFKSLVSDLGGRPAFARRRYALSQEVVMNAVWLWLDTMEPSELAEKLAPFVARVEADFAVAEPGAAADAPAARKAPSAGHDPNAAQTAASRVQGKTRRNKTG